MLSTLPWYTSYFIYTHLSEYFNGSISQLVEYAKILFLIRSLCNVLVLRTNAYLLASRFIVLVHRVICMQQFLTHMRTFACLREVHTSSHPPTPLILQRLV